MKSANVASFLLCLILCAVLPNKASAEESDAEYWSSDFFGISWELIGSFENLPATFDTARIDALSLMATYGNATIFKPIPIRLRAGLGWWKEQPFMASAGIEIALLELRSPAHTRMTGLYVFGDFHLRASSTRVQYSFEPSARVLIPLQGMGGIAIGAGYDTALGLTWHIESMNGIYPLK